VEHAFALMFAVARRLNEADRAARAVDFDFKYRAPLTDLSGKILGIVGFGGIGVRVAPMAKAFGMRVLVTSKRASAAALRKLGCEAVELDELLARADIVSLHRPLLPQAKPLIGARELHLMKPRAFIINTARGGLIDEGALARALTDRTIAGAGLDVFVSEQMPKDHPLLSAPNTVLTPHIAGSSEEALKGTAEQLVERLVAIFDGSPVDVVNPEVWNRRRT
jgi:D-3-phosphoglycerate dehydrogenase